MHGCMNGACARMLRITSHVLPKIRRLNAHDVNVTYAQPHSRTTYVNDGCSVVHTFAWDAPPIGGITLRRAYALRKRRRLHRRAQVHLWIGVSRSFAYSTRKSMEAPLAASVNMRPGSDGVGNLRRSDEAKFQAYHVLRIRRIDTMAHLCIFPQMFLYRIKSLWLCKKKSKCMIFDIFETWLNNGNTILFKF